MMRHWITDKAEMAERFPRDPWILAIGIGKMLKALSLFAVATAALFLVHRDVAAELHHWMFALGIDPGRHFARELLDHAGLLTDQHLREAFVLLCLYATLFAIEGVGLLLRRRWGEYVSIAITGSFIPLEIFETARSPHVGRAVATALNVAAVAYLVYRVRQRARAEHAARA
jgi:uncharacterized membrane protein (DUF2068 family)